MRPSRLSIALMIAVALFAALTPLAVLAASQQEAYEPYRNRQEQFRLTQQEQAWLAAHPTIRIGIMEAWPPLNYVDTFGAPGGIGVDYIAALNKRLNNVLTVVPKPFKENFELVKTRRLDALMDITPKKEREEFLNFTKPYLTIPHVIVARKNGPYFASEKDLNGKTVAIEQGFYNVIYFRTNYPEVTVKEYDTTNEALDAVVRGEADAYAGNRAVALYLIEQELLASLQIQGRLNLDPVVLSIGVRKDQPELAALLDKAFAAIPMTEHRQIHSRWLGNYAGTNISYKPLLTPDEQIWLQAHPVIEVGVRPHYPPFVFTSGEHTRGYGIDLLNLLARKIGLTVNYYPGSDDPELHAKLLRHELDLIFPIVKSEETKDLGLFSKPFISARYHFIIRTGMPMISSIEDLPGKTVAVEKSSPLASLLWQQFPDIKLHLSATNEEALAAVNNSKADTAIVDYLSAAYLMKQHIFSSLQVSGEFSDQIIPENWNPSFITSENGAELIRILDKALDALSHSEILTLKKRWFSGGTGAPGQLVLPETITFNKTTFILNNIALVFAFLLVAILITWIVRGRKPLTIRATLFGVIFIFVGLTVSIGAFVMQLTRLDDKSSKIEQHRYASLQLAFELKQSSDDLTRFARSFAATGKPKFERYYYDILDIRDGKKPHPKANTPSYWDHVAAETVQPDEDGETYSIEERMLNLGLTDPERDSLLLAKEESDALAKLEAVAMNAAKGRFQDSNGNFTVTGSPDIDLARELLNNEEYLTAKARIMRPIDDFFSLLKWRTSHNLSVVQQKIRAVISAITILTIFSIIYAFASFLLLQRRIIAPLYLLRSGAGRLEQGNYNHHIEISSKDEIGDLAGAFNTMTDSIKERTSRLRNIIDTAIDGIIVFSTDGTVQEFSPAAEKIFGFKAVEVIGDTILRIMPESPQGKETNQLNQYFTTDLAQFLGKRTETLGRRKNGEIFPVSISISEATAGHERFYTGIIRDITENKRKEQELRKLSSAVEQSPISVIITDKKGAIEYVNTTFTTVTGYSFEEVKGALPHFLLPAHTSPESRQSPWTTLVSGNSWFGDIVSRTKQGEKIWERTAIAPLSDESGEISHFVIVKEDITERKRLEKQIQKSETLHRLLADCSTDMIIQFGLDGKAAYVSQACHELTGFQPIELIGCSLKEMMHIDDLAQHQKIIEELPKLDKRIALRIRINRRNGGFRWVDMVCQPIRNQETQKITGILAVSRDITEQREIEQELRQNMDDLQRFSDIAIGREERMIELKQEINTLLKNAGINQKYKIIE